MSKDLEDLTKLNRLSLDNRLREGTQEALEFFSKPGVLLTFMGAVTGILAYYFNRDEPTKSGAVISALAGGAAGYCINFFAR